MSRECLHCVYDVQGGCVYSDTWISTSLSSEVVSFNTKQQGWFYEASGGATLLFVNEGLMESKGSFQSREEVVVWHQATTIVEVERLYRIFSVSCLPGTWCPRLQLFIPELLCLFIKGRACNTKPCIPQRNCVWDTSCAHLQNRWLVVGWGRR